MIPQMSPDTNRDALWCDRRGSERVYTVLEVRRPAEGARG
jgi:hypothetical protein